MKNILVAALGTLFCLNAFAVDKKQMLSCEGKAIDGTNIKIEYCFKTKKTKTMICGDTVNDAVKVYFDGQLDGSAYLPKSMSVTEIGVYVVSLNDGLDRHSEVEFDFRSEFSGWNTLKVYSVSTGKKYLSTEFNCSFGEWKN
jgi:hypothetical protein